MQTNPNSTIIVGQELFVNAYPAFEALQNMGFHICACSQDPSLFRQAIHTKQPKLVMLTIEQLSDPLLELLHELCTTGKIIAVVPNNTQLAEYLRTQFPITVLHALIDNTALTDMIVGLCASVSAVTNDSIHSMNDTNIMKSVTQLLQAFGISANRKGYHYLRSAILELYAHDQIGMHVTNQLYPKVAEIYGTTRYCVERAIRSALERGWENVMPQTVAKYLGSASNMQFRPTNSEFIAMAADWLRMYFNNCN